MPEPANSSSTTPPTPVSPQPSSKPALPEEFDRARWTLPPLLIVLVVGIVAALLIFVYVHHASQPRATGKILGVYPAAVSGDNRVMVAVNLSFQNLSKAPMWIRTIHVQIQPANAKSGDQPLDDTGAAAEDASRYLQAFPQLAAGGSTPFPINQQISSGQSAQGIVVVAFAVSQDDFNKRKWLHVVLEPDNNAPITLQ